ncbi:MAG: PA14 domain-containing protein, partial [Phycisphaerae bacterium]|nr:PA14 domain-containing protein [Phycisphaerae bacterium]
MDLRFEGDLALWQATALALIAAGLAWWLYRRETRTGVGGTRAWLLPALRALAVFMIVFMLAGPVLHHREIVGQLSRVLVFIDASGSMSLEDPHLPPDRKILAVHQRGWLPKGTVDTTSVDLAEELAEVNATAAEALRPTLGEQQLRPLLRRFAERVEVVAGRFDGIDAASLPAAQSKQGSLTREFWTNISGSSIGDIQQIKDFPGQPAGRSSLSRFESPANWGDNHVQRLVGYVHPPVTGEYTFWITSDDASELFLSTDQDPSNRKRVAYLHAVAGRGQWPDGSARSGSIRLEAGRRYFIEAIHKEGAGDDFVAVGWRTPDNRTERPIPGAHLSPLVGSEQADFGTIADAAESLGNVPLNDEKARSAARARLRSISRDVSDWERRLRLAFQAGAQQVAQSEDKAVTAALARFDQMSRWRRAESLLLAERTGLIQYLAQKHHLELYALRDDKTERLPTPEELDQQDETTLAAQPDGRLTDLGGGVRRRLDRGLEAVGESGQAEAERTAVVVLTDGRNNAGDQSPVNVAKLLGSRKIPVYTVGLGSHRPPPDLAILRTRTGPIRSVFV